jgi:hypothetical protein
VIKVTRDVTIKGDLKKGGSLHDSFIEIFDYIELPKEQKTLDSGNDLFESVKANILEKYKDKGVDEHKANEITIAVFQIVLEMIKGNIV